MRGFLLGSLALIALQVVVSGRGPDRAAGLLDWSGKALQRALSPDVAAIHQVASLNTTGAAKTAPTAAQAPTVTLPASGLSGLQA